MWLWLAYVAGVVPFAAAWRANRRTTLTHTLAWSLAAWAAWGWAAGAPSAERVYAALALTACAGVSVFGARRPGVGAWNFVVIGLGVVLSLPAVESTVLGTPVSPGPLRTWFWAALLGAVILNYLPTRIWPGVLAVGAGGGWALWWLVLTTEDVPIQPALHLISLAPWLAWLGEACRPKWRDDTDRLWRTFRDRFGAIWGLRLREQFNRAATNAGWPLELDWSGMRDVGNEAATAEQRTAARAALEALMKRFASP